MIPNPAYNNQILVGYMFGNSTNKYQAVIREKNGIKKRRQLIDFFKRFAIKRTSEECWIGQHQKAAIIKLLMYSKLTNQWIYKSQLFI